MEVRLRQDDHGTGAALPGEDQVALEPPQIQVLVQRRDEERDIDIRRKHLLFGSLPGGLARELRVAGQDSRDRARAVIGARVTTTQSPTTGSSAVVAAS